MAPAAIPDASVLSVAMQNEVAKVVKLVLSAHTEKVNLPQQLAALEQRVNNNTDRQVTQAKNEVPLPLYTSCVAMPPRNLYALCVAMLPHDLLAWAGYQVHRREVPRTGPVDV